MQISVDPATLSRKQREAVAGFILAYPANDAVDSDKLVEKLELDLTAPPPGYVNVVPPDPVTEELAVLQHDHESTMPVAAFGKPVADEAAIAFGVTLGAPLAPSTPPTATASIAVWPSPTSDAPTTTVPGVASSVTGVDLDVNGLPWDSRIHSQNRARIADGSWRKGRGVDPALVAQVEAELRQVMGAPAAPLVPAPTPSAPIAPPAAPLAPTPHAPAVAPDARAQFVQLIGRASAALQAQKVTRVELTQICADVGVPELPLLANRLDLLPEIASRIDALIASR